MGVEIIKTIFQFKRSTKDRWLELNPILQKGEPGFEYDTGKLKIGNGIDAWKDLDYTNNNFYSFPSKHDFPNIGKVDCLYKSEAESCLYQWSSITLTYEPLSSDVIYAKDIKDLDDYIREITYTKEEIIEILQESSGAPKVIFGGDAAKLV